MEYILAFLFGIVFVTKIDYLVTVNYCKDWCMRGPDHNNPCTIDASSSDCYCSERTNKTCAKRCSYRFDLKKCSSCNWTNITDTQNFPCKCSNKSGSAECIDIGLLSSYSEVTTYSAADLSPTIHSIIPDYGPVSGGTEVTIKGERLNEITAIQLGDNMPYINITLQERYNIIAVTPELENRTSYEDVDLYISVLYDSGKHDMTDIKFTYKPDPEVVDIYPRKMTNGGGMTITVKGSNLDSVATPMLTVTAINRSDRHQRETFHSPCNVETSQQLKCVTPQIPEKPFNSKSKGHTNLRLRRQSNNDDLEFLVGLQFDGATDYEDLTDNLPHLAHVEVHQNPSFSSGQMFAYNPESEGVIGIKGADVDTGVVVADYEVRIGKSFCTNIGITTDKLYCNPPPTLDDVKDDNNTTRAHNEADVTVRVGAKLKYAVGYIVYDIDETIPLYTVFVPVVAALGALLIAFVIILIICCCRKVRTKKENQSAPSAKDLDTLELSGNDNYYTGETQPKSQYYMVVNQSVQGQRP